MSPSNVGDAVRETFEWMVDSFDGIQEVAHEIVIAGFRQGTNVAAVIGGLFGHDRRAVGVKHEGGPDEDAGEHVRLKGRLLIRDAQEFVETGNLQWPGHSDRFPVSNRYGRVCGISWCLLQSS